MYIVAYIKAQILLLFIINQFGVEEQPTKK